MKSLITICFLLFLLGGIILAQPPHPPKKDKWGSYNDGDYWVEIYIVGGIAIPECCEGKTSMISIIVRGPYKVHIDYYGGIGGSGWVPCEGGYWFSLSMPPRYEERPSNSGRWALMMDLSIDIENPIGNNPCRIKAFEGNGFTGAYAKQINGKWIFIGIPFVPSFVNNLRPYNACAYNGIAKANVNNKKPSAQGTRNMQGFAGFAGLNWGTGGIGVSETMLEETMIGDIGIDVYIGIDDVWTLLDKFITDPNDWLRDYGWSHQSKEFYDFAGGMDNDGDGIVDGGDGIIDWRDMEVLFDFWGEENINGFSDGIVNFRDFAIMAGEWEGEEQ